MVQPRYVRRKSPSHLDAFGLRLPNDLMQFIAEQSDTYGSSQNSEVVRAVRERKQRVEAEAKLADFTAQLSNAFGGLKNGEEAFAKINNIAEKVPLSVDDVTRAVLRANKLSMLSLDLVGVATRFLGLSTAIAESTAVAEVAAAEGGVFSRLRIANY